MQRCEERDLIDHPTVMYSFTLTFLEETANKWLLDKREMNRPTNLWIMMGDKDCPGRYASTKILYYYFPTLTNFYKHMLFKMCILKAG